MVLEQPQQQQRRKSREVTALSCTRRHSSPPVGTGCDPRLPWVPRAVLALPGQSPRWASAAVPATGGSHRMSLPSPSVSLGQPQRGLEPGDLCRGVVGSLAAAHECTCRQGGESEGKTAGKASICSLLHGLAEPRAAAARNSQCLVRSFSLFFFPIVF